MNSNYACQAPVKYRNKTPDGLEQKFVSSTNEPQNPAMIAIANFSPRNSSISWILAFEAQRMKWSNRSAQSDSRFSDVSLCINITSGFELPLIAEVICLN